MARKKLNLDKTEVETTASEQSIESEVVAEAPKAGEINPHKLELVTTAKFDANPFREKKIELSGQTIPLTNASVSDIELKIAGASIVVPSGRTSNVPVEIYRALKNTNVFKKWLETGCLIEGQVFTMANNVQLSVQEAPSDLKGNVEKAESGMRISANVTRQENAGSVNL